MNLTPRILKLALAGVGVAAVAATLVLQVATLNVATSVAQSAENSVIAAQLANEAPAARVQIITDENPGFYAVRTRHHPVRWDTVSITYERADGSPLTTGGFKASQESGSGLFISRLADTPAGDYRVVVNQLTPSEIDHDLIFQVAVE